MKASSLLSTFASRPSFSIKTTHCMSASKRLKLSSMAPTKQTTGSAIVHFYDPDVQAKDSIGRTQEHILSWSNSQLENSHNYIQVLFPLPEGSPYNWSAPVIDLETFKAFRARSELRQQLRKSFERMLTFYGFTNSIYSKVDKQKTDNQVITTKDEEQTNIVSDTPAATAAPITNAPSQPSATETPEVAPETPKSNSQSQPSGYYVVRGPNWHKMSRNWCVRMDHNHLRITRILRCLRVLGCQKECDAFFAALKHVYDDPAIQIGPRSMDYWTRAVERPLYLPPDDNEDDCEWLRAWEKEQAKE